jgi:PadR family transcriptional regulator PadR
MSDSGLNLVKKCSCKGYNLDKLIQPNILTLLAGQDLHGYLIIQELENKNMFQGEKADSTGIYRTLKLMEDKGLVNSRWDLGGSGTAKKVYCITEDGLNCLRNWVNTLRSYRDTIDQIIKEAETGLGTEQKV